MGMHNLSAQTPERMEFEALVLKFDSRWRKLIFIRRRRALWSKSVSIYLQKDARKIDEFMRFLAVCHTVVPEKLEDGEYKYQASSPGRSLIVKLYKRTAEFDLQNAEVMVIYVIGGSRWVLFTYHKPHLSSWIS